MLFDRILTQFSTKLITFPQFEKIVDDTLGLTVSLFGWFLTEIHPLYYKCRRNSKRQYHRVGDKNKNLFHLQRCQLYL